MLLLPLSDMKHLFDFKPFLGHLVQGCVIVLTRHLLHIDTIITLLWQSGLSWLWFVWNLLVHILYIGNMFVSGIALMRNESPKHVWNSCPHAIFQNLIRNQWKEYFFKGLFENPGCMENFLLGICSDMNIIASNFLGKIKLMLIYVRLQVP